MDMVYEFLWEFEARIVVADLPPDLPLIGSTLESRHCTGDARLSNGRSCLEEQPAVGKEDSIM